MNRIFISYRRDDSGAACGRIYDRLRNRFGRDAVFKDVDDIPYGVRFPDYLARQLETCRVELVVIGRFWSTLSTPDGKRRRLDVEDDFVRTEIEMGIRNGLIVVPLLVDNATMPRPNQFPASIRGLAELQGAQVRNDPDFETDMQRLINHLEDWLAGAPADPITAHALQAKIEKLLQEVSAVGDGDLRVQAEVTPDTMGVVADSINFLIEELARLVWYVRSTTSLTTKATRRLLDITGDMEGRARTLEQLAQDVHAHPEATNRVVSSMSAIIGIARMTDVSMRDAHDNLVQIRDLADKLRGSVTGYHLPDTPEFKEIMTPEAFPRQ